MKKLKLIGTLPSLHDEKTIDALFLNTNITAVRYNSGINDLMTEKEIVTRLLFLQKKFKKNIYIDLKGRQLRVESWVDPIYEAISLNHNIEIEYPAVALLRGSNPVNIIHTLGNKIILDRPPERALGSGQSINIRAKSLRIKGYLTAKDIKLIRESKNVGLNNYMASFVESSSDLAEIYKLNSEAIIISKIESIQGMKFVNSLSRNSISLMAARDDLFIESCNSVKTLNMLKQIVMKDDNAICASKIFSSLLQNVNVSLADYEDLELMYRYGYRNYMLGDDIKADRLVKTLKAWDDFKNA